MKDRLDKRICDCEEDATDTQTYREFIRESEDEFGMRNEDVDSMDEREFLKYLHFLIYLWDK